MCDTLFQIILCFCSENNMCTGFVLTTIENGGVLTFVSATT